MIFNLKSEQFTMPLNYEFKAKTDRAAEMEELLKKEAPDFKGEDHQTDTYFNVSFGRLKLREGNIENSLIHYHRENLPGAKQSDVILYHQQPDKNLKDALTAALGIKVVVKKRRKIYFVGNIKFHFDHVDALGQFVEVEAIDHNGSYTIEQLRDQCEYYANLFQLRQSDYIAVSYSDLLMKS
jgi:adenylate cyclase, class 2